MTAAFIRPLPFGGTSSTPVAGSVANLNNDVAGLALRLGLSSPYVIIDLGAGPVSYDYIAIMGSNLRSTDTVTIRTGTTATGIGALSLANQPATSGDKDPATSTKSIYRLPETRTERYIRIDLSAPSHPDGSITASRLVIGRSISCEGIEIGAQQGFETQSTINTGSGWRSLDDRPSLEFWKLSTGWIADTDFRARWSPLLRWASRGGGLLFVPDEGAPANFQADAIYGHFVTPTVGEWAGSNQLRFEGKIVAYAR